MIGNHGKKGTWKAWSKSRVFLLFLNKITPIEVIAKAFKVPTLTNSAILSIGKIAEEKAE